MKVTATRLELDKLRMQLRSVRKASLLATQRGDFRTVAKLTCEAATLNRNIQQTEGQLLDAA
jgi:hypothetical protein